MSDLPKDFRAALSAEWHAVTPDVISRAAGRHTAFSDCRF